MDDWGMYTLNGHIIRDPCLSQLELPCMSKKEEDVKNYSDVQAVHSQANCGRIQCS